MFGFLSTRVAKILPFGKRAVSSRPGDAGRASPFNQSAPLNDGLAPTRLIFGSEFDTPFEPVQTTPPSRIAWHARDMARSRKIVTPPVLPMDSIESPADATMLVARVKDERKLRRADDSGAVSLPPAALPALYDATVLVSARRRGPESAPER